MEQVLSLPRLMVAPNGARRGKIDHPQIPITIPEIVETAIACAAAGADGIHLHVRDGDGKHTLDAGLYRELIADLKRAVPKLKRQITTESVGVYSPSEQRALVQELHPESVSISTMEMYSNNEFKEVERFYLWCQQENIAVQHILYGSEDLNRLDKLLTNIELTQQPPQLLFVLGRYAIHQESNPQDLVPFITWLESKQLEAEWAVCAFGKGETQCLKKAHELGGRVRVGFENSIWNADGSIAENNATRVEALSALIK